MNETVDPRIGDTPPIRVRADDDGVRADFVGGRHSRLCRLPNDGANYHISRQFD